MRCFSRRTYKSIFFIISLKILRISKISQNNVFLLVWRFWRLCKPRCGDDFLLIYLELNSTIFSSQLFSWSRETYNDAKPNDAGDVDVSGVRRDAGRIRTKRMRRNFSAGTDAFAQWSAPPVYPTTFLNARRDIFLRLTVLIKYKNFTHVTFGGSHLKARSFSHWSIDSTLELNYRWEGIIERFLNIPFVWDKSKFKKIQIMRCP